MWLRELGLVTITVTCLTQGIGHPRIVDFAIGALLFGKGEPLGSEKQSATASPSSGDGIPRSFISSLASRRSLPADM